MGTNFHNTLSIREVADLLGVRDTATALRWLRQRGIPIHKMGKPRVFAVHVEVALDFLLAKDLMQQYPSAWESMYRLMAANTAVYHVVVAELKKEVPMANLPKQVEPKTDEEKQLLKKLTKK